MPPAEIGKREFVDLEVPSLSVTSLAVPVSIQH
jgi:hypothetical protein